MRSRPASIRSWAQRTVTLRYFSDGYHLDGVLNLQNLLTYADQARHSLLQRPVSETHTFTDRILNNFILSYQLENSNRGPLPGSIDVAISVSISGNLRSSRSTRCS